MRKTKKPKWLFGFREAAGRKHRMVRAVVGKKTFHCMRCGMRSLYPRVPGVCPGLKWFNERGEEKRRNWKDKCTGGHHLQRIVDVGKVRSLIWCRR